jgi:hypothetical protein
MLLFFPSQPARILQARQNFASLNFCLGSRERFGAEQNQIPEFPHAYTYHKTVIVSILTQLMVTCTAYGFVILNAYYGGAMTMFFTSTVSLPFETIYDVMRAYPTWRLVYMYGNEVIRADS